MVIEAERRVPKTALRQVRVRLGMSQSEFAQALRKAGAAAGEPNGATKRLVQKWESGEHAACRGNYARALQLVTGLSLRELGLRSVVNKWGAPAHVDPEWRIASLGASKDSGESASRLRFALERPARASGQDADAVAGFSEQLFSLEARTPSGSLLVLVDRHLAEISALLCGTPAPRARRTLATAGGHAAALGGWLALDLGDVEGAQRYLDAALAAARANDDGALMACTFMYLSSSAALRGDAQRAWQLAHTALGHAGSDVRSRAWMAVRAAQQAARCENPDAARAQLELAFRLGRKLERAGGTGDAWPWVLFFDRAVLSGMAAEVYATVGDERAAYDSACRAAHTVTDQPVKARALVLAEAACAAARVGHLRQVEAWAIEAHALTVNLQYTAAWRKLRFLTTWLRDQSNSETRRLAKILTSDRVPTAESELEQLLTPAAQSAASGPTGPVSATSGRSGRSGML